MKFIHHSWLINIIQISNIYKYPFGLLSELFFDMKLLKDFFQHFEMFHIFQLNIKIKTI
jgi:hypothetical protein